MVLHQQDLNIPTQTNQNKITLNNDFVKMVETFKEEMKNSLKEVVEKTSKKAALLELHFISQWKL